MFVLNKVYRGENEPLLSTMTKSRAFSGRLDDLAGDGNQATPNDNVIYNSTTTTTLLFYVCYWNGLMLMVQKTAKLSDKDLCRNVMYL